VTRRLLVLGFLVVALVGAAPGAAPPLPPAEWMLEQVKTLADPAMEGRAPGTAGAERAAAHIAAAFKAAGLTPGGEAGTFMQSFSVPTGLRLGTANSLATVAPAARPFDLGTDFTPLSVSPDGAVTSDLVFVGYGITAPEVGYDDYAGVDVRDKVVLMLTREPRAQDPASPFRRDETQHYAGREHKLINARQHGAAAVLIVAHPRGDQTRLPVLGGQGQSLGVLAAAVSSATAEALLAPMRTRLGEVADAIDQALAPRSAAVAGVKVRVEVNVVRERGTARNVIGLLTGTDPALREQAIVIGAHYDHLGRGGETSLAPDQHGQIHPGADDNASGIAVVMALARAFAAAGGAPRTLVFAAFSAEEMGLLGSAEYVRRPAMPMDKTVLMVNLDMVGRLREGRLYIGGIDSGSGLRAVVTEAIRNLSLALEMPASPFGPSDHTSFYVAGCPVLFFFTGVHGDYHRPTDTWDRINAAGLATVGTVVSRVVTAVAAEPKAPAYVKVDTPPAGRAGRGYGAFFGIVPSFGDGGAPGLRITGVRPDSPAERAGVRAGDVIVKFAGVDVKTLEDLTFVLRGRRPGDEVQIVVLRDGREQTVRAVLSERR
jgi:peptidase M28-like protein/PDZ domain-containing protein/PA domain-containing protein